METTYGDVTATIDDVERNIVAMIDELRAAMVRTDGLEEGSWGRGTYLHPMTQEVGANVPLVDDDMVERAMIAGWRMDELFDECEVCGEWVYDDTCACTVERRKPRKVTDEWDDHKRREG